MCKILLYKRLCLLVGFYTLAFLTVVSCNSDMLDNSGTEINWRGKLNGPLGYVKFTTENITKQLSKNVDVVKDATGFVSFKKVINFSGTTNSFELSSKSYDINVSRKTDLSGFSPDPYVVPVGSPLAKDHSTSVLKEAKKIVLSKPITKMKLVGGTLKIDFNSNFDVAVNIELTCLSLEDRTTGNKLKRNIPIPRRGNASTGNIDLSNYDIDLTHDGTDFDKTTNSLAVQTKITYTVAEGSTISTNDKVDITVQVSDVDPEIFWGYFGKESYSLNKQEVDMFPKAGFTIRFENPSLDFEVDNGYGIPMGVDTKGIEGTGGTPPSVQLNYQNPPTNLLLIDPATYADPNVTPKKTEKSIDKSNSNIQDFFSSLPKKMVVDVKGQSNPQETAASPNENFMKTGSKVDGTVTLNLPLSIKLSDYEYVETQDFELEDKFLARIEKFDLVFYIRNSMPLEADLKVEFLDATDNVLSSLPTKDIKLKGDKGSKETITKDFITFKEEHMDDLEKSRKIKMTAKLKSVGADFVKLYEKNEIDIQLSIRSNVKYEDK